MSTKNSKQNSIQSNFQGHDQNNIPSQNQPLPQTKTLNLKQMINLCIGLLGIQFAWALQVANMSGIYAFYHAKESDLGLLWIALPVTGLIIQPIIGYLSDITYGTYGKRLPYIFWGSILTAGCMVLMPNAPNLYTAAVLLWFFTAAINIASQPFRSLVADILPEKMLTRIYAIQTCLLGVGATLASLLPWILTTTFGVKEISTTMQIPYEIKISFYSGALLLFASITWTTVISKNYLPKTDLAQQVKFAWSSLGKIFRELVIAFVKMPPMVRKVSYLQFFTWMGVFSFLVYFTSAIGQEILGLPANVTHDGSMNALLEKSTLLTGIGSAVYTLTSVVFALFIPRLSHRFTRKKVLAAALTLGGLSLISLNFIHREIFLFLSMIGVGIAWASFNSLPFAMVAGSMPKDKMGLYMGIFNIAICVPQIIVGLSLGYLLNTHLHNHAVSIMVLAGIFFLIAALFTTFTQNK